MLGPDLAVGDMRLHRAAAKTPVDLKRRPPERGDLGFMRLPLGPVVGRNGPREDWAEHLVLADAGIERRDEAVDILGGDLGGNAVGSVFMGAL